MVQYVYLYALLVLSNYLHVCMYVVWVYWGDGNKFMYLVNVLGYEHCANTMYVCMYVCRECVRL